MSSKKKLYIIDAMAMAFRNYHAFGARPLTTSKGFPTSAIFGSANFILRLIEKEKPDYLLIATDTSGPTFRHEMYPAYKANRGEMPEDLSKQIPVLFRMFEAMNIPLLSKRGVEADDLIGSVVTQFHHEQLECYIVSGDKDFMQLIKDGVYLYAPKKAGVVEIIDDKGVFEKFGCQPQQVIDILALIGDTADNVPGVKGIGDKGAAKLIHDFGSLDRIYENLDKIANKRQQSGLSEHKSEAYLSKQLVTIKTDIDLECDVEKFKFNERKAIANDTLLNFFVEMEFGGLVSKIQNAIKAAEKTPSDFSASASTPNTQNMAKKYRLANNKFAFEELLVELNAASHFAFDTETTGLNKITDKPIGISFSTKSQTAWYVPIVEKHLIDITPHAILQELKPFFVDQQKMKIAHNLKFDLQMLENVGVTISGPVGDTMIAAFLVDASDRFGIDHCSKRYLGIDKIPTTDLIGKKAEIKMIDVPLEQLSEYACEDADCCFRLHEILLPTLENKKLLQLYLEMDMPLVAILAKMEKAGVFVNAEILGEISINLDKKAKELETQIYTTAGEEFNINSPKQLQFILFEKIKIHELLGITKLKKTQSGYSTDVTVLEMLDEHPLPALILEYRTVTKLKNTYVDALPQLIEPASNRIHTNFHQTGTQTGRLSSSDPNLQNIPIRSDQGREIRKAFTCENPNNVIISADYSQIELRLLAHISGDENLQRAFMSGKDIHIATAATMFKKDIDQVDREDRSRAKAINYGLVYGMGPKRLAKTTHVTMQEAKQFIESYFASFPKIKNYIENAIAAAKATGYSTTMFGRRRPIEGLDESKGLTAINAQNIAVNSPIQGSASDLIKLAMIKIQKSLESSTLRAKMLLQVHDELVFECHKDDVEEVSMLIKTGMEQAVQLAVPLEVDINHGMNWLEAH